jgi:hypothetical protein
LGFYEVGDAFAHVLPLAQVAVEVCLHSNYGSRLVWIFKSWLQFKMPVYKRIGFV